METQEPSWRVYPEGVPIRSILDRAKRCDREGDWIGAANWYFHAKRRGHRDSLVEIRDLLPKLEEASGAGNLDASVLVAAVLLEEGRDLVKARNILEEAAAGGNVEGMRELAVMLTSGLGGEVDFARANRLFENAAENGDGYAAFNLAVNFYHGKGAGRNFRKFEKWLNIAGGLGIPEACAVLGDQCSARGASEDALNWYVRAAGSSHVPAMLAAAFRYRDGVGCDADPVQALRWFLAALERENADGVHEAIGLAKTMTRDQILRAGALSGRTDEAELLTQYSQREF